MLTPILEEDASERVLKIGIYNYRPSLERKSTQREILDSSGLLQSTSTCGTHSVLTTGFLLLLQSPASLRVLFTTEHFLGLPWWLCCKEPTCQCRRCEFDPWLNKFPWRRKCNPLQYSCLQNCMDRGVWWATFHGIAKDLDTT